MDTLTLYVAGPMSGLPDWGRPAFAAAAGRLEAAGYRVLNPAGVLPGDPTDLGSRPWQWWMRRSLHLLLEADGVALLDGWADSRGAAIEADLARKLGMRTACPSAWIASGLTRP